MLTLSTGDASPDAFGPSVVCLQCGYDLRGIPEQRCPECGYGYDHTAIRALALEECWLQDCSYRKITRFSVMAAALSMPSFCWAVKLRPTLIFLSVVMSLLIGILFWRRFTPARAPKSANGLLLVPAVVAVLMVLVPFLLALPLLGNGLALVFIFWAIFEWNASSFLFQFSPENVSLNDGRLLRRDQRTAIIAFLVASVMTLSGWA